MHESVSQVSVAFFHFLSRGCVLEFCETNEKKNVRDIVSTKNLTFSANECLSCASKMWRGIKKNNYMRQKCALCVFFVLCLKFVVKFDPSPF